MKTVTVNPDLIETVTTLAQTNPLAAFFGGVMVLAAISYKWGF